VATILVVVATSLSRQGEGVSGVEELIIGLAILAGLIGIVVPVLPGALLVLGAILVWAFQLNSRAGWATLAVATVAIGLSQVVKYLVPGRRLKAAGIPNRTLLLATCLGIVGFFVVPVVGLFLGFVLGVYLAERQRLGGDEAWPATQVALRAVGLSILIELAGSLIAAGAWLSTVLVVD
jgi:uncharacterized protein YqgC (DUF456 family)